MKMDKKGGMLESTLGRVVLAVILLVVIIGIIFVASGKMGTVWGALRRMMRFG